MRLRCLLFGHKWNIRWAFTPPDKTESPTRGTESEFAYFGSTVMMAHCDQCAATKQKRFKGVASQFEGKQDELAELRKMAGLQ